MSLISACSSSTDGSACDAIEIWQAARRGTFATVPNQDDIVSDAISTSIVGAVSRCCVCGDAIDRLRKNRKLREEIRPLLSSFHPVASGNISYAQSLLSARRGSFVEF